MESCPPAQNADVPYTCAVQEDSRSSYLQPPTDVVLQREKLRESFKKDSDAAAVLNGRMDGKMGLSDSTQRSNSGFAASASSNGAPAPEESSATALHEGAAHAATPDADHRPAADSHSPDSSDVGGSIDEAATIQ